MGNFGGLFGPKIPKPAQVAASQQDVNKFNTQLAQSTLTNQRTPTGSLTFTPGEIDPATGLPRFTATTQFSPENQAVLQSLLGTKGTLGETVGNLASELSPVLSRIPDFSNASDSLTNQMLNRFDAYMQPAFTREREFADTKLRNQGIFPGSPAYIAATQPVSDRQIAQRGQFLNTAQPLAFNEAMQGYLTPIDVVGKILGLSGPLDINNITTPTFQQNAPSMADIFKNNLAQQQLQYQNQLNLISGGLGTIAGLPTGAGGTIGSGVSSAVGGGIAALLGLV